MLKLKVGELQEWPTSTSPAIPASCKKSSSKSLAKRVDPPMKAGDTGTDSRPWNSTKVAKYDKQC